MKRLAIIGAGYLQRPLVERAKQMGIYTICIAWSDGAVCRDICDQFYPVSIIDKEEVLRICQAEHIDGVCTIASDIAAPTVSYVAEHMGLSGNSYETAIIAHDKHRMREALSKAGVECPGFRAVSCQPSSISYQLSAISFQLPLIVKPTDRSGSLGVQKVTQWEQLEPAIKEAQRVSMGGEAIVEEYIEGREISVEMISSNGIHHALQITDKVTTGEPHFVELAHHQPSSLPQEMQSRIFDITRRALDALGIRCGASHSEYKITDTGRIVVMEIGGRMGGDFIGSDLVKLSTGYDFLEGVIEVAFGMEIDPQPRQIACSGVYFLSAETPYIAPYIDNADQYPEIVKAERTDSELHELRCSANRSGYCIYRADHRIEITQ